MKVELVLWKNKPFCQLEDLYSTLTNGLALSSFNGSCKNQSTDAQQSSDGQMKITGL